MGAVECLKEKAEHECIYILLLLMLILNVIFFFCYRLVQLVFYLTGL